MDKFELIDTELTENYGGKKKYWACFEGYNRWMLTITVEDGMKYSHIQIFSTKVRSKFQPDLYVIYKDCITPIAVRAETKNIANLQAHEIPQFINELSIAKEALEEIKRRFIGNFDIKSLVLARADLI